MARRMSHYKPGVVNVNSPWQEAELTGSGGGWQRRLSQKAVTSHRTGTTSYKGFKWDIQADDLIVDTRAGPVNEIFTTMVQSIITTQFKAITKKVSEATQATRILRRDGPTKRRHKYKDAKGRGGKAPTAFSQQQAKYGPSYARRYAGGRIGHIPPATDTEDVYLRDSGRLQHTTVRMRNREGGSSLGGATGNIHTKGAATINFPANRLDPAHPDWRGPRGQNQLETVLVEMRRLVPVLGTWDAKTLQMFDEGMNLLMAGLIHNSQRRYEALLRRRAMVLRQLLRAVGINVDFAVFTQQLRMQRAQRIGQRVEKETIG